MRPRLSHALPALLAALFAVLAACGRGGSKDSRPEATLAELNRARMAWGLTQKTPVPSNLEELTNFPSLQGKRLPTPLPGKRLAVDPATGQIAFVDQ
jgi:hypothetical protein